VTATNVFAHVDNLRDFMKAVDLLLSPQGVFIFEAPHFGNLVRHLEYDTIYHEHLSYLSVKPLLPFFAQVNMEVFDVQERDIHGGSFRVFVCRQGQRSVSPAVMQMLDREEAEGLYSPARLNEFASLVERNRDQLTWLLYDLKRQGKRVVGVSAPAKGMTLLNYCGIGSAVLDFVTEKSTLKIDRFTPGTHIPVLSDEELLRQKPDYALLLAWNFAAEIMDNLSSFTKQGGQFIIPIPVPRIVSHNENHAS
jgi:hypothetical protein